MATLDWLIILAYLGLVGGLAAWVFRRRKDTPDDYFLANRNLGWFIVGASIFASNIGSEHLVGLAGSGATDGVALAHYELHAWCLLILAWVFIPFFMRSRVYTMPEFLERRFSPAARWVLSLISLVSYVLTKIAVGIFAGGVVFATLLPDVQLQLGPWALNSFWVGSLVVIVLTGIYTVAGGMRAVAYTEALQTLVLVVGSGPADLVRAERAGGLGGDSGRRSILTSSTCGSRSFPRGWTGRGRRCSSRTGSRGTSTGTFRGRECSCARRSSACGTGAPTSTSCSARWERGTRPRRGAAASSPGC